MKNKWLVIMGTGILAVAIAATALAASPIKLVVNGKEITPDVSPQLVNGRTMVPVRWVAEALGAQVDWDEASSTVEIEAPTDTLRRRLTLLEKALTPASPEEAVRDWATAVQTRNGAWQYVLLAPALQERYRPDFEMLGWVTGVSSPWVDKYTILEQKEDQEGKCFFTVQLDMMASTGAAGSSMWRITVQPRDRGWHITAIDSIEDERQPQVQLQKQVEDLVARKGDRQRD